VKVSIALDGSSAFVLPDQLFGAGADCAVRIAHFQQYEAQGRLRSALRRMSEREDTDCLKQVFFSVCRAPCVLGGRFKTVADSHRLLLYRDCA